MSDKVYLRDLVEADFTKDEFISYYNRCMFLGIPVCEDASFRIGKYKNIGCGIYHIQDEDVIIPGFVDEIYNNGPYLTNVKVKRLDLNKVKTVCRNALNNYYCLEEVKGDNVKTLGAYSFYGCHNVKEMNLPKLKYLGSFSFTGCYNMSKFSSLSLKEVTNFGFSGCGLDELYAPNLSIIKDFGYVSYNTRLLYYDRSNLKMNCADTLEIYTPFNVNIEGNYEIDDVKEFQIEKKSFFNTYKLSHHVIRLRKSDKYSVFKFRDDEKLFLRYKDEIK